jgi:hypothetical protein
VQQSPHPHPHDHIRRCSLFSDIVCQILAARAGQRKPARRNQSV